QRDRKPTLRRVAAPDAPRVIDGPGEAALETIEIAVTFVQRVLKRHQLCFVDCDAADRIRMIEGILNNRGVLDIGVDDFARLLPDVVRRPAVVLDQSVEPRVFDIAQIYRTALPVAVTWKEPMHLPAHNPARGDTITVLDVHPFLDDCAPLPYRLQDLN